jgi:hypothetical protein
MIIRSYGSKRTGPDLLRVVVSTMTIGTLIICES